jgi:hypothetical protein
MIETPSCIFIGKKLKINPKLYLFTRQTTQTMNRLYNNYYYPNHRGKRVDDYSKLQEGQYYIIDGRVTTCGPLIKTYKILSTNNTLIYGMQFSVGFVKYDGVHLEERFIGLSFEKSCFPEYMFYEYIMDPLLLVEIKHHIYYTKIVNNLCKEIKLCEDLEKQVRKYLVGY